MVKTLVDSQTNHQTEEDADVTSEEEGGQCKSRTFRCNIDYTSFHLFSSMSYLGNESVQDKF